MDSAWYSALSVLADSSALVYWRMANGVSFWWKLTDRSQLQNDRVRDQPILFSEIASVTIYREARAGREIFHFDWPTMKELLERIAGLRVNLLAGVRPWPSCPPTDALELTATDAGPEVAPARSDV